MDHPRSDPFRDNAIRTDTRDWHPNDRVEGTAYNERREPLVEERRERIVGERGVVAHAEPPVERRRFSLGATFLGWSVAAFFTLVFVALLGLMLGGTTFATGGVVDAQNVQGLALGSFIGYLVVSFLAYLIGGYAAGRIALWDGLKHGLLTVAWAVLFALLAVALGAYFAESITLAVGAPLDMTQLTGVGVLAIVLSLAAMLGGAAVGGKIGERYHDRAHGMERAGRTTRTRGRPL